MTDWAAEFAKRNAAKAAKEAERSPLKTCVECGMPVGSPVCKDGTRGVEPLCWDCWIANDIAKFGELYWEPCP